MILGYTLTTFPKVTTYIFMHNPRRNKDLSTIARKGTLHKLEKKGPHKNLAEKKILSKKKLSEKKIVLDIVSDFQCAK